ncbi:hypothetical protein LCGC14_2132540 [marine sediment metagenome]|uniref:Uncharacterized protein n=1 Tax=marine sediment metagenome TaxID=412755 RepID=A0A0F9EN44_9ZZZZ
MNQTCKAIAKHDLGRCRHNAVKGTEFCWVHTPGYKTPLAKCRAENDKLRNALQRIDTWAKAYPLEIFPKPDLGKAANVLKASGMTLGSISADSIRHVLDGVKGIVTDALVEAKQ